MSEPVPSAPPWWALLPPAQAQVSCGAARHRLRWADGRLTAPDHPDAEGELVLAALGGDRSRCVDLVESWGRRGDDLEVLVVGPRSAADQLTLTAQAADDPAGFGAQGGGWFAYAPLARGMSTTQRLRSLGLSPRPTAARLMARRRMAASAHVLARSAGGQRVQARRAASRATERREELFALLALGPEFQLRLSATVAAAWAGGGSRDRGSPALVAALAGRLAPAAQAWLGIDPGRVDVSVHEEAGWGRLTLSGDRLVAALPVGWLASVWAAGLAVVAGHLVVAVAEAAWPQATVLAVPGPGADPVILEVRAVAGRWIRTEGAR